MSKTVDERVVEMRFDNKQFEQNIQTSLSSLDKLKKSLNLEGAAKGLETVNDAANKCSGNMSPLSNAVETVRVRFSALEVMAITALQNITNSALAAGKNLVSAFTIDPIKTGFEEYETQINAVQTILANTSSKGTTLDQVNNALDELNHYADMTIYNFTEMTRNIGTFTAAGVDLDTSVAAIKGIANLAAVSGSNSQQASTAMYQLSQALASGTVKLQDWNSVVNAGMGGQVFQDALKETAKVHGIAIDEMIKDEGSFRETLSKGWLTSDILTETLAKFTGDLNEDQLRTMGYTDDQIKSIMEMGKTANDAATKVKTFTQLFDTLKEAAQSGWTQSWEIIVGDFEEAKELLTEVSDTFSAVINASADARNKMLQDWKDLGGRTMMIEAVKNVFEGLVSVVKPVREAFNEIFPPMTGKQLAEITERIRDLTAKFKMGEESSKNLKNTFKGVFAVLDIVGQAFKAVAGGVGELIGLFLPAGNGVLSLTGSFGEYLVKLDETVKKTDIFGKSVSTVVDIVKTAITFVKTAGEKVKEFGKAAGEKFDFTGFELFHSFLERVHDRMAQIGDSAGKMKSGVIVAFEMMGEALEKCKFLQVLGSLWNAVKAIGSEIADLLGSMISSLGKADFNGIIDLLNGIATGGLFIAISNFLNSKADKKGIFGFIESLVESPLHQVGDILDSAKSVLDGVRESFEAYQTNLKAGTLIKIATAIGILAASIVVIATIDSDKLSASLGAITVLFANLLGAMAIFEKIASSKTKVSKACTAMIAMSVAVSILAGALKKVSDLDWGELARGLVGIAGLTTIVVASSKAMASGQKQVMKGATSLIIFGAAIKILASACKDLSKLQWDELGRGLTGVGVIFAEIAVFLRVAKFNGKMLSTATGIVILAAAMKVLASACKDFGQMEWGEIGKGLAGIGGLLAELAIFTNLAGNAKHVMSTGVALITIGAAMKIFASAVKDFGQLQWDEIGRGLTAMGVALAEVAIAVKLMPKNMIGIGTGLVIVGGALEIIANCMSKFGGMQWEEIGRGLTVMGGALAELAISLNFMKGTLGGSAALLVASGALAVLAPVLSILGALSWEAIAKGLISIAGAFTIIGVAGAVLTPLVPTILALSGAFALIGVGVLTIGAGLLAAGTGLSALAIGFTALATAGAAGATAIVAALTVIVTGIAGLIPAVLTKVGEGIIAIAQVIITGAPVIVEAFITIVSSIVQALSTSVPQIVEMVVQLLVYVLNTVKTYSPQIIQTALDILLSILKGISNNISAIVQSAIDIVIHFLQAITAKLPDVIQKGVDLIVAFVSGISKAIPQLVDTGFKMIIDFINGLAQSMETNIPVLMEAIEHLVKSIISGITTGLTGGIDDCIDSGKNMMKGFAEGIEGQYQQVVDTATGVISGAVDAIKDFLGIHSPSKLLSELGEYSGEGFIEGLISTEPDVEDAGESLAESAYSGMEDGVKDGETQVFGVIKDNDFKLLAEKSDCWDKLIQIVDEGTDKKKDVEDKGVVDSKETNNQMNEVHDASIAEEERYWERLLTEKKKGQEAEKYKSMSMVDFRKSILEQTKDILKNYTDALKSNTDSLMNDSSLFRDAVSANDLTKKLKEQILQIERYKEAMTSLNSRIADGGLKDAINQMGVDSLEELELINGMTDEQLSNYVNLYDQKYALCQEAASIQLSGLQKETEEKLSSLYGGAQVNLQEFAQSFDGTFESIRSYVGKSVEIGSQLASGVAEGIKSGSQETEEAASQMIKDTEEAAKEAADINSPSGLFRDEVGKYITEGVAEGMVDSSAKAQIKASADEVTEFAIQSFTESKEKFTQVGVQLIDSYREGISNSTESLSGQCTSSMNAVLTLMQQTITASNAAFENAGRTIMTTFISGVRSQNGNVRSTFLSMVNASLNDILDMMHDFQNAGQECMIKIIAGVKSKDNDVRSAFVNSLSGTVTAIRDNYNRFKQAGAYLVEGFAEGITENTFMAEARARAMAKAAAEAAEEELDINSPSKVGYRIGNFFGLGFVNAIGTYGRKAYDVSADMANSAKTGLSDAISKIKDVIDGNIDSAPTIRPVLDLSDVEAKSHRLNALFSRTQALAISTSIAASRERNLQNEDTNPNTGNSYNFTQNNYSPKALSRTEIYRQTKNQFSAMERMVET